MKPLSLYHFVGIGLAVLLASGLLIGIIFEATNQGTPGCDAQTTLTGICFPSSPYAAQVVQWATAMANALYVKPSCGQVRSYPDCYDTWYHDTFPQAVIAYGQHWCQAHGDCADWANGTYQCVSFVRGAYSQVYPMTLTNNAFDLWATYQKQPGWQEIPSAAVADPAQRGIPEAGDVMVFKDTGVGHVAIILSVQLPVHGHNGWITFANANSSSAYDRMPLLPSLLVDTSGWQGNYVVWGYLRPRVAVNGNASQRLIRISQLDRVQYATPNENGICAYSACSTAAMTEVPGGTSAAVEIADSSSWNRHVVRVPQFLQWWGGFAAVSTPHA